MVLQAVTLQKIMMMTKDKTSGGEITAPVVFELKGRVELQKIHNFMRFILDLIYPTRCPSCGKYIKYTDGFCAECYGKITLFDGNYSIANSDLSVSVCVYDDNISQAVFTLKDHAFNAPYAFAKDMSELLKRNNIVDKIDFIVPVPMYKSDKIQRGFNQMELVAKELHYFTNIPYRFDVIFKCKKTKSQKGMSADERKINLKNAFVVKNPEKIKDKSILVIDDICTTGNTLGELSRILKQNGAKNVFCCTYCKTLLKPPIDKG